MNNILRLLLLWSSLFISASLRATHLVGGEISYQCLGNNDYEISLTIYRDCGLTSQAPFDDPAFLTIYDGDDNLIENPSLFSPVITPLVPNVDGLCLNTLPNVCIEKGVYVTVLNLQPNNAGYYISYQRCCRNGEILNILNPDITGNTYTIGIPAVLEDCANSSPVFNSIPPIVICADAPLIFDHSASDIEGDSLVYSLCNPLAGADDINPAPPIVNEMPYPLVQYENGYSAQNPLGGLNSMSIDPATGVLTAFPPNVGRYVIGICVTEYRNGEILSVNVRDFQFNVAQCQVVLVQANVDTPDIYVCAGQQVQLHAEAFGADLILWEPTEGLNDPNILNPIVLNPQDGDTYTLYGINASGCEDSDVVTLHITGGAPLAAGEDQSICGSQTVQLNATTEGAQSISWQPANGLSDPHILNPLANPTQTTTYTITVDFGNNCISEDEVTIFVTDPTPIDAGPDQQICAGGSTTLSINAPEADILWQPATGLSEVATATVSASPLSTTTYTVTAIYGLDCIAQDMITITVGSGGDAGQLVENKQLLCDGEILAYTASGASVPAGSALAYYIHSSLPLTTATILLQSQSGNFSAITLAALATNQTYYITAAAGPANPDGYPDLNNPCTDFSNNGSFVLLQPVQLLFNEYCDWEITGDFTITISATGGGPMYDASQYYTLAGTNLNAINLSYGNSSMIALGQFDGQSYSFTASDANGCTDTDGHTVVCYKTPITLQDFYGMATEAGNELHWSTGSETEHAYFALERADDGQLFNEIYRAYSQGNSYDTRTYHYTDKTAPNGPGYYRLKSVSLSGTYEYSSIILITRRTNLSSLQIGPHPTGEWLMINIPEDTPYAISNIQGKIVKKGNIAGQKIALKGIPAGIYILQSLGQTVKFVKE